MEEKDLKQIGDLFEEKLAKGLAKGLGQFWEGNLEPAFDNVYNELQVIQTKLDRALYTEVVHLEARVKRLEEKSGIATKIVN